MISIIFVIVIDVHNFVRGCLRVGHDLSDLALMPGVRADESTVFRDQIVGPLTIILINFE